MSAEGKDEKMREMMKDTSTFVQYLSVQQSKKQSVPVPESVHSLCAGHTGGEVMVDIEEQVFKFRLTLECVSLLSQAFVLTFSPTSVMVFSFCLTLIGHLT